MIVNKTESKDWEIPADGLYQAVLADVVDLGTQSTNFGDKLRARFVYILSETDSEGRPFRLMQQLNQSLHEKSGMYKVVRRLLGKEPGESLEMDSLIGKQCQLDVVQNEGKEGKIYANVVTVLSPVKNQAVGIPADFVRYQDKDKEQKSAPKPATTTRVAPKAVAPKVAAPQASSKLATGIEVGPQDTAANEIGKVTITDEDIPF